MIKPAIPRRKVYEYYKKLEKEILELNIVTASFKNYLKYIYEYKKYHHKKLEEAFVKENAVLQIYLFEYIYNSEVEFNRLVKRFSKKHMDILQHEDIKSKFRKGIKNIYYSFKKIKLNSIYSYKIINFIIKHLPNSLFEKLVKLKLFPKEYLLLKELYNEFCIYEDELLKLLEKRK